MRLTHKKTPASQNLGARRSLQVSRPHFVSHLKEQFFSVKVGNEWNEEFLIPLILHTRGHNERLQA